MPQIDQVFHAQIVVKEEFKLGSDAIDDDKVLKKHFSFELFSRRSCAKIT